MYNFSENLNNLLTQFVASELSTKMLYGVTYAFFLKDNKIDMEAYEIYSGMRREADKCGFSSTELIRMYELPNGFIVDLEIQAAKEIFTQIIEFANKYNTMQLDPSMYMTDRPEQKRKKDMMLLAKNIKSQYDSGKRQLAVALFNRNVQNKIVFNALNEKGEKLICTFDAYSLRHWDIETLNKDYLIPAGFRVSRLTPFEILPTKTGVHFNMELESMDRYL